jgi:hypothetical protein
MSVRRRARKAVQQRRLDRQKLIAGMDAMIKQLREKIEELKREQAAKEAAQ